MTLWRFGGYGKRIRRNRVKCLLCDQVIESKGRPETDVWCGCGGTGVNGATHWLGRGWGERGMRYQEMAQIDEEA